MGDLRWTRKFVWAFLVITLSLGSHPGQVSFLLFWNTHNFFCSCYYITEEHPGPCTNDNVLSYWACPWLNPVANRRVGHFDPNLFLFYVVFVKDWMNCRQILLDQCHSGGTMLWDQTKKERKMSRSTKFI